MKTFERSNYVITLASIAAFIVAFISTAPTVALPDIALEFGLTNVAQNWVMNAFLFSVAIFAVPFGKLSGKIGIKRSFIIGVFLFLVGSIITALSFDEWSLIACRAFQGIGAALIYDTMTTILVFDVDEKKRGSALGILISMVFIGLALAPVLGGILTYNIGWRGIFYFSIPFCIIVLYFLHTKVPDEWKPFDNESFDRIGSVLYGLGILFAIYGFSSITSAQGTLSTIIGAVLLIAFVLYELKTEIPVYNIALFKNRTFTFANIATFISYIATFIVNYILNYHFQYILGMNVQTAGLILIVNPLTMAIVAPISGRLSDRITPQKIASFGMALVVVSLFILSFLNRDTEFYIIITAMILLGAGLGIFSSPNTNIIMSSVPEKETPSASVALTFMRVVGQSSSLAMLTIIFTLVMGNVIISPSNHANLIASSQIVLTVSTVLCVIATLASLVGIKNKN